MLVKFQKSFLVCLFIFIYGSCLAAENIQVFARTDKTSIPLNQTFTFIIQVKFDGDKPQFIDIPSLTQMQDFYVLNRWSGEKRSIQIVNGRMEKSQILETNYQLQPKSQGKLRIESLDIKIDEKIYKTKPLFVTVTAKQQGVPATPTPQKPFSIPSHPLFDSFLKNKDPFSFAKPVNLDTAVQLELRLDKKSLYQGESLKVDWVFLTSSNSVNYEIHKRPQLKDFWKEEGNLKLQNKFLGTMVKNNVLYRQNIFDSMVLFPLKSGVLTLDPYVLKVRSLFGFRSQGRIKSSSPQALKVKPLPDPGDRMFSGAVGKFKVQASLQSVQAQVNEPIIFNLRFEGDGHPQFIKQPHIPFPSSLESYSPVEKSEFNWNGESFKNYEILLLPQRTGRITIPSFQVSTFDPETGLYVDHQIPAFHLNVSLGDKKQGESLSFVESKKPISDSLNHLKILEGSYWPSFLTAQNLFRFWIIFYIGFLICLLMLVLRPFKNKKQKVQVQIKKGLKKLAFLIENKKERQASLQLIYLIELALNELAIDNSSSDWQELIKQLPPSLSSRYGPSLSHLMEQLETLNFSHHDLSREARLSTIETLYKKAERLLVQLFAKRGDQ